MRTIQAKLTLAFLVVIVVCLLPTSVASGLLIRGSQQRDTLDILETVGRPIAAALAFRPGLAAELPQSPGGIATIADEAGLPTAVRIVILDAKGSVLADTEGKLAGRTWTIPAGKPEMPRPFAPRLVYQGRLVAPDGEELAAAAYRIERRGPFAGPPSGGRPGRGAASGAATTTPATDYLPDGTTVLAVSPWNSAGGSWGVLTRNLQLIGLAALAVAVALAFVLSRSLSARLRTLTQGAHAMASGDYDSAARLAVVKGRGDEVDELTDAFGQMARSVSRAQQAQRDLVANVSHELRTPLTSIGGFSQAMEDGTAAEDPAETRALAAIIRGEAARMERLVAQMLELSRLESGTVALDPVQLRVDEFVTQIGRRYMRLGEAKDVTVRHAAPSHIALVADAGRLEQVLVNLLDNALQYTDAGGTVALTATVREGAVAFAVRDTGRGIPSVEIPRLFERFYQVDRARSGGGRHVGLGLAIVREIVDAHGGAIRVESVEGAGTTVTVTIPLAPHSTLSIGGAMRVEGYGGAEGRTPERRPVVGGVGGR